MAAALAAALAPHLWQYRSAVGFVTALLDIMQNQRGMDILKHCGCYGSDGLHNTTRVYGLLVGRRRARGAIVRQAIERERKYVGAQYRRECTGAVESCPL